MEQEIKDKIELTEVANKLFMYTDERQWQLLLDEVFTDEIEFDMSSLSGQPSQQMKAIAVCEMWKTGFAGIDHVHHQAGHYVIDVKQDEADIFGYAVAWHYKKDTTAGHTRSFTGSYDLRAKRTKQGWRLTTFKYNFKFVEGNVELK